MPPPGAVSWPLKTRQLNACCLRFGSWLLPSASFTFAITISKSAVLSGLMTLNIRPASVVNFRDDGTAAGGGARMVGRLRAGGVRRWWAVRWREGGGVGGLRRGGPRPRRDRQQKCENDRQVDHRLCRL